MCEPFVDKFSPNSLLALWGACLSTRFTSAVFCSDHPLNTGCYSFYLPWRCGILSQDCPLRTLNLSEHARSSHWFSQLSQPKVCSMVIMKVWTIVKYGFVMLVIKWNTYLLVSCYLYSRYCICSGVSLHNNATGCSPKIVMCAANHLTPAVYVCLLTLEWKKTEICSSGVF